MKVTDNKIISRYDKSFVIFLLLLAGAMGVTTGIGEGWWQGLGSAALILGFWLALPWVPWQRLELLQTKAKDERQHSLLQEAGAVTGIVMVWWALVGSMIDAAHGREGEYSTMCVVGGATFLLACLVLPRLRR